MVPAGPRGFTLIELLVVLGLMMLLMGLTVGAIVSRPRIDAMIGAEQALSGALRQARHTARTTGQPVVLRLKKAERQIAGLLREPLWHALEGWPTVLAGAGDQVSWPGRTGTGLRIPEAFLLNGDPGQATDPPRLLLPGLDGQPLTRTLRLWRGATASRPPLMLSVAVLPPIAGGALVPDILPLVLVGEDAPASDAGTDFANDERSQFGLMLVNSTFAGGRVAATHATGIGASWEVLGWFGAVAGGRVEVSSIHNVPAGNTPQQGTTTLLSGALDNVTGFAEAGPLTGGRWTELTLLFDGNRLVLYRDGRRVGENAVGSAVTLTDPPNERVYVGVASTDDYLPARMYASGAVIDDVRLERLGDALAGNLPNGVQPDADYTITCHPDGRVEAVPSASIRLTSTSGPAAILGVETTGAISLSQVTP